MLGFNSLAGGNSSGVGSGGDSGGNALTGEFRIEGRSRREVNPYEELKEMLDILVGPSQGGVGTDVYGANTLAEVGRLSQISTAKQSDTPFYSLSRMSGTLYVQARPSVMRVVAELVQRTQEVLGRQILLEFRHARRAIP